MRAVDAEGMGGDTTAQPKAKDLVLAIVLNALLPGVGYMYMGRVPLGVLVLPIVSLLIILSHWAWWLVWMLVMGVDMYIFHLKNKREVEAATLKKCPSCAEMVRREALVCKHCHEKFSELWPTPATGAEEAFYRRRLCPDEACIGVIGSDNKCSICGHRG
jgi:TM2 domain-containing membrane protein YozV